MVKVSQNAVLGPRRNRRKRSEPQNVSICTGTVVPGPAAMTQLQTGVMGCGRLQNLEAASPLGSLLRSPDPFVNGDDGERACSTFSNNFNPLSIFGLNFWPIGPRVRIERCRRVMQKSLKALHWTVQCRNSLDSWTCPGQKGEESSKSCGVVG